ncbi:MAG: VanZ family protein [Paludibacter sp.]|nr:VanZ family protein [Paludibacter sp.]
MKIKVLYNFWKSILFTIIILYLSFTKPETFQGVPTFKSEDKLVHILLYVFYGLIIIYDYRKAYKNIISEKYFYIVCIAGPIILGGIIEIMQGTFFKPRSADWFDWFCDIGGILLAFLISKLIRKK